MRPRIAELSNSLPVVSLINTIFPDTIRTIKRTIVEVVAAIASIVITSSSFRQILKTVGTVAQNNIAVRA
jgi:hypothetical protein